MKTSQGGYKAMLRDRCPSTVDFALKLCKAKTKWVNYVYDTYVWFLKDKKDRDQQVRALLGISKLNRNFEFDKTIEWESLSTEELTYWKYVSKWVHWWQENIIALVDKYETLKITYGSNEEYFKNYICKSKFANYSKQWQEKLYNELINHIKTYYV